MQKIFKNKYSKIWQQQKNNSIFATQNKNMLRSITHIKSENQFSPVGGYPDCGACNAAE